MSDFVCVCVCPRVWVHAHIYIHVNIHVYICIYVYMSIYIYIYIYVHISWGSPFSHSLSLPVPFFLLRLLVPSSSLSKDSAAVAARQLRGDRASPRLPSGHRASGGEVDAAWPFGALRRPGTLRRC